MSGGTLIVLDGLSVVGSRIPTEIPKRSQFDQGALLPAHESRQLATPTSYVRVEVNRMSNLQLLIAHRKEGLRYCPRVLFFEGGRIISDSALETVNEPNIGREQLARQQPK
jgi:hypothetical protein